MKICKSKLLALLAPFQLLLGMVFTSSASAGEMEPEKEGFENAEIRVVAQIDAPASGLGDDVAVLDHAEITALMPLTAIEALSLIPGVTAFEKGGPGAGSYLSIRGGEPNFTLVTINGVRVNDPLQTAGGAFDFSLIEPADISAITILSGPHSTPYGADSLAGVANIEVGAGDLPSRFAARAGIGSDGRYIAGGRMAFSGKTGQLFASARLSDTQDFHPGSSNRRQTYLIAAQPDVGEDFTLDIFGLIANADSIGFPEDSGGPEFAVNRALESRDRSLTALGATGRARLSSALSAQLKLGWTQSKLTSASPGIAAGALDAVPPISSDSRFERLEIAAQFDLALASNVNLAWGGNFVSEDGQSTGILDFGFPIPTDYQQDRTLPGLYTMITIGDAEGAALHGGIRADFPDDGQTRWTPRIGGQLPLGHSGIFLRANYARGFKQPSLFALGFPLIANPDLQAERSTSFDAGLEWRSPDKSSTIGAQLFRSEYRDLIDFDPDSFTNVNRSRVTAQGVEISARHRSQLFGLRAALTYLDTESADGAQLRFRPRWTGRAALDIPLIPQLDVRLDGAFSSSFIDSSIPTGFVRMDGYAMLAAQLRWAISDQFSLTGSLRNLTNARYQRTIGTTEPGRNVFIALEANF